MGFDFPQALGADDFQSLDAVGDAALVQVFQAAQFGLVGSHDDLAAAFIFDFVFIAKAQQLLHPGDAEIGFVRAGAVVNAGMDYAAVVAGLVGRQLRFFFQHRHPQAGETLRQVHGGGKPDDAPADDGGVVLSRVHIAAASQIPSVKDGDWGLSLVSRRRRVKFDKRGWRDRMGADGEGILGGVI